MATRIRRVADRKEMDRVVDDFITLGFTQKTEGENSVLLVKKQSRSGTIHIILALTTWWLLFLPNIIYLIIARNTAERVLVKVGEQ